MGLDNCDIPWAGSAISEEIFLDFLYRSSSRILDMSLDESGSAVSKMVDLSIVNTKRSQELGILILAWLVLGWQVIDRVYREYRYALQCQLLLGSMS